MAERKITMKAEAGMSTAAEARRPAMEQRRGDGGGDAHNGHEAAREVFGGEHRQGEHRHEHHYSCHADGEDYAYGYEDCHGIGDECHGEAGHAGEVAVEGAGDDFAAFPGKEAEEYGGIDCKGREVSAGDCEDVAEEECV